MSPTDQPALPTLQAEHAALVESAGGKVLDHLESIRKFVARVVAAGAGLDAKDDRVAAQGFINFWVARVSVAARAAPDGRRGSPGETFDETLLADPAPDLLARAVSAAEERISRLSDEDKALTRRVVLRLVRLQAAGDRFEAVPTVRAALADLDDPERVTKAIDDLAADGVIRVTKGETPDLDRVALRSPDLLTRWPSLVGWRAHRVKLRTAVREWAAAGKPAERLAAGDDLEDARRYHDRNNEERDYVTASAYRQARQVEQAEHYRRRMWVAIGAAGILLGGLGLIIWFGSWALIAEVAKRKAETEKGEEEKQRTADVQARQDLSTLRLLVRGQAEVVTARTEPELEIAEERWRALVHTIPAGSELGRSAPDLLSGAKSTREVNQQPPDDRRPKTDEKKVHDARNSLAKRQVVRDALVGVREVAFEMSLKSAREAHRQIDESKRFGEAMAYVHEFRAQYWGEMLLVEGDKVRAAMIRFGRALDKIERVGLEPKERKDDEPVKTDNPPKKDDKPLKDDPARVAEVRRLLNGLSLATIDQLLLQVKARKVPQKLIDELGEAFRELEAALKEERALTLEIVLHLPV